MKSLLSRLVLFAVMMSHLSHCSWGQEPTKEDGWLIERDAVSGGTLMTRELTLHPQPEPKPALKHRLLPDEFDLLDGNAALYYVKAMGFLEQSSARAKIRELQMEASAKEKEQQRVFPPHSYTSMAPNELPLKEVNEYLALTQFQSSSLEEARKLRSFSMDRNIRQVDDPISYLLPEIQSMRELARNQSIRCRTAIAENRVEDAFNIIGQQIALAKHLGTDDFYVSALVGVAVHGIAWNDALYLIEHPKTPNLYWAYACLPSPLIDLKRAHAYERQVLFEQIKVLRDVDETPRPAGYWELFVDRFVQQAKGLGAFETDSPLSTVQTLGKDLQRASAVAFIAAAYPSAKKYLSELGEIPVETIEAYPTAQVVFLAMKKHFELSRDEAFKVNYLPMPGAMQIGRETDSKLMEESKRVGLFGTLSALVLPNIHTVRIAQCKVQQQLTFMQTIEAIRMYGSQHDGKLPRSLNDLPVPAPIDPISGQPLLYELNGDTAIITGQSAASLRRRIAIRFAAQNTSK